MSTRTPATIRNVPFVETTEVLYAVFAGYRLREHVEGCPCCIGREEATRLARVPLRALSADSLGRYAFKAMTTWGNAEDYKHFLPRVLELATTPEGAAQPGLDIELITEKLELAGWCEWPQRERDAVLDHLRAFAVTVAAAGPGSVWEGIDVESAIRGLAGSGR